MTAIDHEAGLQSGLAQTPFGLRGVARLVIPALAPPAQDDVAVRVARGGDDRSAAVLVDAEETVRRACREQGVERGLDAAVRAVFETDRHRKSAGHLAVRLGFRRARADGGPTHHVGQVLRHDRIEKFGGGGQTERRNFEQDLARQTQTGLQIAGVVHARIVDQALPPDGGARFLEIHAHENADGIGQLFAQSGETLRIIERPFRVVDRARSDDGEQSRVPPVQDGLRLGTPPRHGGQRGGAGRQLLFDDPRGNETHQTADPRVFEGAAGFFGRHGAVTGEPGIKPQKPARCNSRLVQRLCARSAGG